MYMSRLIFALCIWSFLLNVSHSAPTVGFCKEEKASGAEYETESNIDHVGNIKSPEILATTFSEKHSVATSLLGRVRDIVAEDDDLDYYVHPRVVTDETEWDDIISQHTNQKRADTAGTWSNHFRRVSLSKGPLSRTIATLYRLEKNGSTAAYDGRAIVANSMEYQKYREGLADMASYVKTMNPVKAKSFFLCAFWADVSERSRRPFLSKNTHNKCIFALVSWAKHLLAHRAYHCNPDCPLSERDKEKSFIWNMKKLWVIGHDSYSAGSSMALAYDVLFRRMRESHRLTVRSALSLLVLNRNSWGTSETSTRNSPNALEDPHRIISHSALQNAPIYITNLAIEGETGFDRYTSQVLSNYGSEGFNKGLDERFSALIKAYMTHAIYPDGSLLEDGRVLFTGLREGSLALVASHRRGSGILDTNRFRNLIHFVAQMHEPWRCGSIIEHSGGGGSSYSIYLGLFKYAYPNSDLSSMLWRQRFGEYEVEENCRKGWWQEMVPLSFFGSEHTTEAESVGGLSESARKEFKLSFYASRRGLLIARNSFSDDGTYLHFDSRPDAFYFRNGHADRGVFTFSSLGQTWITDLPAASKSRMHNLMHVDGIAQARLAPSARMLRVTDNGRLVLAVADLTYAYNYQWRHHWGSSRPPTGHTMRYNRNGRPLMIELNFNEEERSSPWALGWPQDDLGKDLGFSKNTILHGASRIGVNGLWIWRRKQREESLKHMVRSVGLVRENEDVNGKGVMFFVDSVDAGRGARSFESYLMLNRGVRFVKEADRTRCNGNVCRISLRGEEDSRLDIYVFAQSNQLSFRIDALQGGFQRLVFRSDGLSSEEMWTVLCPHEGEGCDVRLTKNDTTTVLTLGNDIHKLQLDNEDHGIVGIETPPMIPYLLRQYHSYELEEVSLHTNKEAFLHRVGAPLQAVFKLSTSTDGDPLSFHEIRTCESYTSMKTHIAIYDCGPPGADARRYMARDCELVSETGERNYCSRGSQRCFWKGRLGQGSQYYAAVSGYPIKGLAPRISVLHLRRRV